MAALESLIDVELSLEVDIDKAMAKREGLEFKLVLFLQPSSMNIRSCLCTKRSQMVRVTGLISASAFGKGRTSSDRQYYYINGRPFVATKVSLPGIHSCIRERQADTPEIA